LTCIATLSDILLRILVINSIASLTDFRFDMLATSDGASLDRIVVGLLHAMSSSIAVILGRSHEVLVSVDSAAVVGNFASVLRVGGVDSTTVTTVELTQIGIVFIIGFGIGFCISSTLVLTTLL